jgi:hypothetical protein
MSFVASSNLISNRVTTKAWNDILWPKVHKRINRMQCRIYKARVQQNKSLVQWLQKHLINSLDAKLVAVQ